MTRTDLFFLAMLAALVIGVGFVTFAFLGLIVAIGISLIVACPAFGVLWYDSLPPDQRPRFRRPVRG